MNSNRKGKLQQDFLLGNEAIAWGAIEANIDFIAGYPGTPSSEILETLARYSDEYGIYVEWSTNEMVAFENALGASLAGQRAMVTMKHAGMNFSENMIQSQMKRQTLTITAPSAMIISA